MSEKFSSYLESADSVVEKWQSELSSRDIAEKLQNLFLKFKTKLNTLPNLRPEQKTKLEADLRTFLFDSVTNALNSKQKINSWQEINTLGRFNREGHDTNRLKWLDSFESERYVRTLNDALAMIAELGGIEKFRTEMIRIHREIEDSRTLQMGLMGTRHEKTPYSQAFAEKYTTTITDISPEELKRLQYVKYTESPTDFFRWLSVSIGTKLPVELVELVGKFVYDAGKSVMQFPEYFYFAYKFEKATTSTGKFEYSEKMKSRLDDNLALGFLALLYDGTADITRNIFLEEWKISADAQSRRFQELVHSMGKPSTWTPEWVKDAIIALAPFLPKLVKAIKNMKSPEKSPDAMRSNESQPRLIEDIPREPQNLRAIEKSEHLQYSPEKLHFAQEKLTEIIGSIRYNSLDRVVVLLRQYEKSSDLPLINVYKDYHIKQPLEVTKAWGDCTVMSIALQTELRKAWIDSKVIRFLSNNLINGSADLYVGDSHSALVIPKLRMGQREFVLLDPGLFINKAIPFSLDRASVKVELWEGKWAQVVPNPEKWMYPSTLFIWTKDGKLKKLPFDPTRELINPHETLSKDLMRGLSDFKFVKQTAEWVPLAVTKIDIQVRIVTIQLWSAGKTAIRIPFDTFELEILKPVTQNKLEMVAEILWETPTTLTDKIRIVIRNTDTYKKEIWNPSTRKAEDLSKVTSQKWAQ